MSDLQKHLNRFWLWAIKENRCAEIINDEQFQQLKEDFAPYAPN